MINAARLARAHAMRVMGEQRGECALDQLRLAHKITAREHEAGVLYRACWRSMDPAKHALCSTIDSELELRVDYDAPLILRVCAVHQHAPRSSDGLERLRQCLSRAAAVIETLCGELAIAAD